jgi:hypothetical protein
LRNHKTSLTLYLAQHAPQGQGLAHRLQVRNRNLNSF